MYPLTLLQLLLLGQVQSRLAGHTMNDQSRIRNLGRWSFDEPCIAGPVFYENPSDGISNFDAELKQYTRTEVSTSAIISYSIFLFSNSNFSAPAFTLPKGRIYEDENCSLETTVHSDTICDFIEGNHIICDYFMVDDTVGVFSLFSGLAELEFDHNRTDKELRPTGKGRYVFQGGSDLHGGIIGKVNTIYEEDLITHDFCVQGSTYDHLIPPLPPISGDSNRSVSTGGDDNKSYGKSTTSATSTATISDTSSNSESADGDMMVGISCVAVVVMTSLLAGLLLL